jgi:hypothetical protein
VLEVRVCVELHGALLYSLLCSTTAVQDVRACVELLRACRRYIWSYCRVIHCLMLPMIAMQEVLAYV